MMGRIHAVAVFVPPFGVEVGAWHGFHAVENGLLRFVAIAHAVCLQVAEYAFLKESVLFFLIGCAVQVVGRSHVVGLQCLYGEWAAHSDALLVLLGLVVEYFFGGRQVIS